MKAPHSINNQLDPAEIAKQFLAAATDSPNHVLIKQLCQMSFDNEPTLATKATQEIFSIIESLCDDFSDFGTYLTSEVLAELLEFIRRTPDGAKLNKMLTEFGFKSSEALLKRYKALLQPRTISSADRSKIKKILILSRVTAGADIAITGVIIKRLSQSFPDAKLILIGPSHLREMYGDIPNTCCFTYIYKNDGTLFEKMTSWPQLLTITQKETYGYGPGETVLFDPDSRLSQLGLLPLLADQHTYIFPSRLSQPENLNTRNLSFLANQWINSVLGENKTVYPKLSFAEREASSYRAFYTNLKNNGCRFVVTINLGVGNDPAKKIEGAFEEVLIKILLKMPKTIVVLDTGRGESERQRVESLLQVFGNKNIHTDQVSDNSLTQTPIKFNHGLVAFKGSLGALGKMIDATDCFIGYDSCGQHIAAATRTPAVIIFAGAPTTRFIHRWAPTNKENLTLPVNTGLIDNDTSLKLFLDKVEKAVNRIRSKNIVSD